MLARALVSEHVGGSVQFVAVDEELQGFGRELDLGLTGFAGRRQVEGAFSHPFCVELEELDAVLAFVG